MSAKTSSKKVRMTVSLSRATAKAVKTARAETNAPSMSAFFEKLVADWQSAMEQEAYDKRMRAYYDSLSPAAIAEQQEWGAMGEIALAEKTEMPEPLVAAGG